MFPVFPASIRLDDSGCVGRTERGETISSKKQLQTKYSKVPYYVTNCFMACDIYPYTHTHTHRALLWKQPCKYLPPCLLCCYSSHPRIVSFFLSLSLPRVRDSQLAVETTIQSVSHSPFSLYILLCTKGPARLSESSVCVCACESTRCGEFRNDYQWWVTMVMANIRQGDLCVAR